jgi:hypothetical protein
MMRAGGKGAGARYQSLNLAYVVLLSSRYLASTSIAANLLPAFWFPPKMVKQGDNIIVYSNAGTVTQETNPDGTTNHFFHWGFPQTIWQDPAACVVVVDVNSWQTSIRPGPAPNQ